MPGESEYQLFSEEDWKSVWAYAHEYPQYRQQFMALADEMGRWQKAVWNNGRRPHELPPERPDVTARLGEIINQPKQFSAASLTGPVEFSVWNEIDHPRDENHQKFVTKSLFEIGREHGDKYGEKPPKSVKQAAMRENGHELTDANYREYGRGVWSSDKVRSDQEKARKQRERETLEARREMLAPFIDEARRNFSIDDFDFEDDEDGTADEKYELKLLEIAQEDSDRADEEAAEEEAREEAQREADEDYARRTTPSLIRDSLVEDSQKKVNWIVFGDRRMQQQGHAARQMVEAYDYLVDHGWRPEYLSDGSVYFERWNEARRRSERFRVADHEVPETAERRHNSENGGFSWATSGSQLILPVDDVSAELESMFADDPDEDEQE